MSTSQPAASTLFSTVVKNGHCIGCGACAAFDPGIEMRLTRFGQYEATLKEAATPTAVAERVCPFADGNPNEDEIGRQLYGELGNADGHLGFHVACYAGWVTESDFRSRGSSGGVASWILAELLERDLVDHVVHVASVPGEQGAPLFRFTVSSTAAEVRANAKSRYYPVEMSGVIQQILEHPGRYAVTGIPCFIKALRLASRESSVLRDRITFTLGIVCGHLKSTAFAELFAWQCGIEPKDFRAIDFRTKLPGRAANGYAVTVTGLRSGEPVSVTRPTAELYGADWGHGFFKYKACDFCDDVVGETADVSIGDAWLPEYEGDPRGANVIVVRSPVIHSLLVEAAGKQRLHLDRIPAGKAVESQAGGFRHRREGLAFRLHAEDTAGNWRPQKRVEASCAQLTKKRRKIYSGRYQLGQESHRAFAEAKEANDLELFMAKMLPRTRAHDRLYRSPLLIRIIIRIKRLCSKLISKTSAIR